MSRNKANAKALELAKQQKQDFFLLSERRQAKLIGCHWQTWRDTPFFAEAQRHRTRLAKRIAKGTAGGSPPAISLTGNLEAVAAAGKPDEVLNRLAEAEEKQTTGKKPQWEDLSAAQQQEFLARRKPTLPSSASRVGSTVEPAESALTALV